MWMDGKFSKVTPEKNALLTPGVMKGIGVFETMRADCGKIFFLKEHMARLFKGLKELNITCPYSRTVLNKLLNEGLKKIRLNSLRIRLIVWQKGSVVNVGLLLTGYKPLSSLRYSKGFRVTVKAFPDPFRIGGSEVKSIRYEKLLKTYTQAQSQGFDEVLLLNRRKFIVEASRCNVFWVKGGIVYTPALSVGCLNGIVRRQILAIAQLLKLKTKQGQFNLNHLLCASEAFVTNSLIEIMPIVQVNNHYIGQQQRPVFDRLNRVFQQRKIKA